MDESGHAIIHIDFLNKPTFGGTNDRTASDLARFDKRRGH